MTSRRHCAQAKRDIFQLPDGCYSNDRLKMKMLCMFHSGNSYESSALSRHVKISLIHLIVVFTFCFSYGNISRWKTWECEESLQDDTYVLYLSVKESLTWERDVTDEKNLYLTHRRPPELNHLWIDIRLVKIAFVLCVAKWGKCWRSWTAVAVIVHLWIRRYRAFQSVRDVSENESESETN